MIKFKPGAPQMRFPITIAAALVVFAFTPFAQVQNSDGPQIDGGLSGTATPSSNRNANANRSRQATPTGVQVMARVPDGVTVELNIAYREGQPKGSLYIFHMWPKKNWP